MNWTGKRVLVTGGSGFIGSHLADALVDAGATVTCVDLRSRPSSALPVERSFCADLTYEPFCDNQCWRKDYVFHLAADLRWDSASNFLLDQGVLDACRRMNVGKIVYASSAAVYPLHLQQDPSQQIYLEESWAQPPYDPDGNYGLSKLVGEKTLASLYRDHGLKSACARIFPAYGPRCSERLAIGAMIGRALRHEDPFEVWGDGTQVRGWTHVSDIVAGLLLLAEKVDDATSVNLGSGERITVLDAARLIFDACQIFPHGPPVCIPELGRGSRNMVADNALARSLGWEPRVKFDDGIRETVKWFKDKR